MDYLAKFKEIIKENNGKVDPYLVTRAYGDMLQDPSVDFEAIKKAYEEIEETNPQYCK